MFIQINNSTINLNSIVYWYPKDIENKDGSTDYSLFYRVIDGRVLQENFESDTDRDAKEEALKEYNSGGGGTTPSDALTDVSYDPSTGILDFTRSNGEKITIDLPLELLIQSGSYNSGTKKIVLVLANGESIEIDVADLISTYYADDKTIVLTSVDGKQTFKVKEGKFVEYDDGNNVVFKNHAVVPFGSALQGNSPDKGWTNLAAVRGYELETEHPIIQTEIGSASIHTNINSSDVPTIETADGKSEIATKKYVDDSVGSIQEGKDGATFTPSVDVSGNLSWTNDKGLANPDPVNIKGPKGDTGDIGPKGAPGERGETGPAGTPGTNGQDGITPTIGDNGNWYLGETDTGKPSRGEQGPKGDTGDRGPAGTPGTDGQQGPAGADGAPGENGISITEITQGETSESDGYTVTPVTINKSDSTNVVLQIKAKNGTNGAKGDPGDTGAQGVPGPAGADGQQGLSYLSYSGSVTSAISPSTGMNFHLDKDKFNRTPVVDDVFQAPLLQSNGLVYLSTLKVLAVDVDDINTSLQSFVKVSGADGENGQPGAPGPANSLTIGTVSTLEAGEQATVQITGDAPNQVLNFGIPKGAQGATGSNGANGSDGAPGQGVPTGGTEGQVLVKNNATDYDTSWKTLADLVNALPSIVELTSKVSTLEDKVAELESKIPSEPTV